MSFNKVIIVGYLGRDPELRITPQGIQVCDFSVATTEKHKDGKAKDGIREDTTWFRVTLWRTLAESASKYLKKGSPVYLEGRLTAREWTDREGINHTTLEVSGTEVHYLESANGQSAGVPKAAATAKAAPSAMTPPPEPAGLNDDEVPF